MLVYVYILNTVGYASHWVFDKVGKAIRFLVTVNLLNIVISSITIIITDCTYRSGILLTSQIYISFVKENYNYMISDRHIRVNPPILSIDLNSEQ